MSNIPFSYRKALAIIPMTTGTLSLLGSCAIIYKILSDRGKKMSKVYHRLMLAMSSIDIIQSLAAGFSTIPIPNGIPSVWGNIGDETTCNIQGFGSTFGFGVLFYNGSLSLYFLLSVRYGITDRAMEKVIEPTMHFISIAWPLSWAIAGLPLKVYNFSGNKCWIAPYPQDCIRSDQVDCIRGEFAYDFRMFALGYIAIVLWSVILTSQFLVFWTISKQEREMRTKYGENSIMSHSERRRSSFSSINNPSKQQFSSMQKRTRAVAVQAMLYVISSVLTFAFAVAYRSIELRSAKPPVLLLYLSQVFFPLQGFLNFFIYVRPVYNRIRERNRMKSRLWAFRQALRPQPPQSLAYRSTTIRRRSSNAKEFRKAVHYTD